ncbi:hypothetical protein NHX12_027112 [Muraenolepis orangiensis]|uniref:Uncharacterized protein n=1 Tax=Muraenolepis orangiensis TaxID=630683 RepID=A0A9Q0EBS8_9TELE|nr:hypothetical protein NHX12_027112 [Muraenolepis orangiensis]
MFQFTCFFYPFILGYIYTVYFVVFENNVQDGQHVPIIFKLFDACLQPVLVAVGTMERQSLIQEIPSSIVQPTQCLMDCTALTPLFTKRLELGDNLNIRLKDSTEEQHGNLKEYCWPLNLKCIVGERLQQAFVVVPVDSSVASWKHLEVKSTGPIVGTLRPHHGPTTLADDCGIRYEVTPIYRSTPESPGAGQIFCVRVAREPLSGDGMLKCPPFLVTVWQPREDQHKREGGG